MGSSLDHRWVPKPTPQRDRLYHFFTKSVGALYAGLLVLFQGRDVRGGRPSVPTEEWNTARPPPRPIGGGGGVPSNWAVKIRKGVFLTFLFLIVLIPKIFGRFFLRSHHQLHMAHREELRHQQRHRLPSPRTTTTRRRYMHLRLHTAVLVTHGARHYLRHCKPHKHLLVTHGAYRADMRSYGPARSVDI
jgi:hypothetical protein